MDKLKVAVIGCGKMGLHHLQAINTQENTDIVAVVDPAVNRENLTSILPSYSRIYSSADQMFAAESPDVVHIVTPPETHHELTMMALKNNANVYVEKPFSLRVSDTETVLELAREKNLRVCAAHQVLFQLAGQKYQTYMPYIKELVHVESYFSFKTVRASISVVDQLLDIMPHPVYLLLSGFNSGAGSDENATVELVSTALRSDGEVRAVLRKGKALGMLVISLNGRPVESYLRLVGTNGSINADFVLSGVSRHLGPGASAIAAVLQPFVLSWHKSIGTIASIFRIIFKKQKGYAGLSELIDKFYDSIRHQSEAPVSDSDILDTVRICSLIGEDLQKASDDSEAIARKLLEQREKELVPVDKNKAFVLVTGGTGFLGKVVIAELRSKGWPVRVIARRMPAYSARIPGIEYYLADIGEEVSPDCFKDVGVIVHLAAETAGGRDAHERNTVKATEKLIRGAAAMGIKQFVNIGSIAVMKPSSQVGRPLDETAPVDIDNLGRGPYVWGKAKAELLAEELAREYRMGIKTIRLGPLVDYEHYSPPGRLGREVGTLFVAMGSRKSGLSICNVQTASNVIRWYLENFDDAPEKLNLVDPKAPTRRELVDRLLAERNELSTIWMPNFVLKTLSLMLKLVLKIMKPGKKPLDLYAAFSAEKYNAALAQEVIGKARSTVTASD